MSIFDPFLQSLNVVIFDGGLATELERKGADLDNDLWSAKVLLDEPDLIRQSHYEYFMAGADVAITSSYQISFDGFRRAGISEAETFSLLKLSVDLACTARDEAWQMILASGNPDGRIRPLIAASIGSYGASLADGSEYKGEYGMTIPELVDWHSVRFKYLASLEGVDFLACETLPCIDEVRALIQILNENPSCKATITVSCQCETKLSSGESISDLNQVLSNAYQGNLIGVGVNCTSPIFVESLLRNLSCPSSCIKIAYPNSGETWDATCNQWHKGTSKIDTFSTSLEKWLQVGVKCIGGCCRTSPCTIKLLRDFSLLKKNQSDSIKD